MNSYKRIQAMMDNRNIDRPCLSLWKHFPIIDTFPDKFIRKTISFQKEYGWDFIKICHHGLYSIEDWGSSIKWPKHGMERGIVEDFAIKREKDWNNIKLLSPHQGALERELVSTKGIVEEIQKETPVVSTVFSPLTTAFKMSGDLIFEHIKQQSYSLMKALETIKKTTLSFTEELVKIGVDGIFFATQLATHDKLSVKDYTRFGREFDIPILETIKKKTWFNILHLHGTKPMFNELEDYPVQAINWHDRRSSVTLKQAREKTDKVLIGGIDEYGVLKRGIESEIKEQAQDALYQAGTGKIILGPGCVVPLDVEEKNFHLLMKIVEQL